MIQLIGGASMQFIQKILFRVLGFLAADWPILLLGTIIAVAVQVYVDKEWLQRFVKSRSRVPVFTSVGFGAFTPLCACGTMAVIISMLVTALPWGPIMAFLISSPLTSPSEFLFQASFLGTDFAVAVLIFSLGFGVLAGFVSEVLDRKYDFFKDQLRFSHDSKSKQSTSSQNKPVQIVGSDGMLPEYNSTEYTQVINEEANTFKVNDRLEHIDADQLGCGCAAIQTEVVNVKWYEKLKLGEFVHGLYELGVKRILLYFVLFIILGQVVDILIPSEWIQLAFGNGNGYSVPLAASIGLPLYVSGSSALPLLNTLIASGAGKGAVMAFLITGKATGVPVIVGLSTILRKKAIAYYVVVVYLMGIASGLLFDALLALE